MYEINISHRDILRLFRHFLTTSAKLYPYIPLIFNEEGLSSVISDEPARFHYSWQLIPDYSYVTLNRDEGEERIILLPRENIKQIITVLSQPFDEVNIKLIEGRLLLKFGDMFSLQLAYLGTDYIADPAIATALQLREKEGQINYTFGAYILTFAFTQFIPFLKIGPEETILKVEDDKLSFILKSDKSELVFALSKDNPYVLEYVYSGQGEFENRYDTKRLQYILANKNKLGLQETVLIKTAKDNVLKIELKEPTSRETLLLPPIREK